MNWGLVYIDRGLVCMDWGLDRKRMGWVVTCILLTVNCRKEASFWKEIQSVLSSSCRRMKKKRKRRQLQDKAWWLVTKLAFSNS